MEVQQALLPDDWSIIRFTAQDRGSTSNRRAAWAIPAAVHAPNIIQQHIMLSELENILTTNSVGVGLMWCGLLEVEA
jgi:hypothetical protein